MIGVPDERMGEVGAAFVVARRGPRLSRLTRSLRSAATNMANYKVPRHVYIVDELPVNASGKVLKNHLRSRAVGGSPAELKGS